MIISFSFRNRAVCRRWRDAVKYSFAEDDFKKIAKFGTESVLRLFLAQHPSADWCKGLYHACKKGNKSIAQIMVQRGARSLYISLYIACKKGYKSIVKILIQCGADDFNRGLFYACKHGSMGVVKYLSRYVDRETYSEYLNKYCC